MRAFSSITAAILLTALVVAGCGVKGDPLPPETTNAELAAATTTTTSTTTTTTTTPRKSKGHR